jgi:hypothetical protein
MSSKVFVAVRVRGLSKLEESKGNTNCLQVHPEAAQVSAAANSSGRKQSSHAKPFTLDAVLDERATQRDVYDKVSFIVLEGVGLVHL